MRGNNFFTFSWHLTRCAFPIVCIEISFLSGRNEPKERDVLLFVSYCLKNSLWVCAESNMIGMSYSLGSFGLKGKVFFNSAWYYIWKTPSIHKSSRPESLRTVISRKLRSPPWSLTIWTYTCAHGCIFVWHGLDLSWNNLLIIW